MTGKNIVLVGETQSTIFLYTTKDSLTTVISRSEIKLLTIHPPSN
jgi:hypothetical protein